MKIIFDENIPYPLLEYFLHHEVTTVQKQGWSGTGLDISSEPPRE